jgi:peroxiredoxin
MKEWQFNVLFFVGMGGIVVLLFSPKDMPPGAVLALSAILTFILNQKRVIVKPKAKPKPKPKPKATEENVDV